MQLVIFDVDGTLIDLQHHIHAAMTYAFEVVGREPLPMSEVLSIVGLSLPQAVARLAPDADAVVRDAIVAGYKDSFMKARVAGPAPLYAGARDCLDELAERPERLLGVATGKSRRGLDAMILHHGFAGRFVTRQVADDHPSKPHPSMLLTALAETGIDAPDAVMVGDTVFDIEMARAAGITSIGVSWGYHPVRALREAGATTVAEDFSTLTAMIEEMAR